MSIIQFVGDQNPPWYTYLILLTMIPVIVFVIFKIFINYKVIRFGNNQVNIDYKVRKRHLQYPLNQIVQWKESIVKTGKNSTFKELEVLFEDGTKIRLGNKEYTNYPDVHGYLTRRLGAKKVRTE